MWVSTSVLAEFLADIALQLMAMSAPPVIHVAIDLEIDRDGELAPNRARDVVDASRIARDHMMRSRTLSFRADRHRVR